ncbi:Capsular glucan synthase [Bacteroidales bacterium Barb7]|nr:Capsular glucan synthase [Bacteroidales bacterium Barb7]
MKILYDPQMFSTQKFGGITRYFYELIKNLDEDVSYELPLCLSNNHYISNKDISNHIDFLPQIDFRGKGKIMTAVNKLSFGIRNKKGIDVVHPTYYDPYFIRYIEDKPFVLTVYDMIHEKYAHLFNDAEITTKRKRLLCENSSKIIAISENTKKDLIDIFSIKSEKIEVVYLGQSLNIDYAQTIVLPDRYILFTGQRGGYKNFKRFATAFSQLVQKDKDLKLICTGNSFLKEEIALLKSLNITSFVLHLFVDDNQLVELYKAALLFVFPSEYEGFGIPILEAFACKCPIALSNTSCFPEIARDAGMYFDPLNADSIAYTMQQILYSESLRKKMIEKGTSRLTNFSWQKMAKDTCALYKKVGI